ncbi:ATPase [Superficieibacter electus]|uniref:ATPase n=1 Tax=Superficieibacter electus TaxID=2022662 RepID=A0A2P5GNK7_9ENTR|nr:MoxR family ATPase [Superficieibacter electus]POP43981.1 ATPase [Superficieibacter electus]POP48153.1 ATPase [Superficieibacter electus]
MLTLTPHALDALLDKLISATLHTPLFIWGAPGIGKSQVVHQVAQRHHLPVIDVRLSQLMPGDIRGLPVADHSSRQSVFYPPDFLPTDPAAQGILFLDEFNQAPPAMQGITQQLILDRRVGSYQLPAGITIIAAGNRKQDRTTVYDLPAPVANRFLHLTLSVDLSCWRRYAQQQNVHEHILAFLAFRGDDLLHKIAADSPAWPSPRSWMMANDLYQQGLPVELAVGSGCATEFEAFTEIYQSLPDIDHILQGKAASTSRFPHDPSARWATITALVLRQQEAKSAFNAACWLVKQASAEWLQRFFSELLPLLRENNQLSAFAKQVDKHAEVKRWLDDYLQRYA